jgi:glyoxylase-like metal-dependent hydrolase (beta-lactamase superfamily II)/rhodanese-related sulfurtransferase
MSEEWNELQASVEAGTLDVTIFSHPQGCRSYVISDRETGEALTLDVHLDFTDAVAGHIETSGLKLKYIVDTHTHADHPSGAGALAAKISAERVAHEKAGHTGVTNNPADGAKLTLGSSEITVRHAPGHTPDHMILVTDAAVFTGDSLFIGAVARTDFLGGDAGMLFDTLHETIMKLPDETMVLPGHDYQGKTQSTIGEERAGNPWLRLTDRDDFVRQLTANPPPRPANMDDLLRLNREGVDIPAKISAADAAKQVSAGGAVSVIDVRTGMEFETEHVEGSRHIPVDQVKSRAQEVMAVAAPRMIMCQSGRRAEQAAETLSAMGIGGLSVIEGGMNAFSPAGGDTVKGKQHMSLERQVRIIAGFIVVLGCALAWYVNPYCILISAFVGCGLMFAGITGTCGMALVLAKMPWNRVSTSSAGSAGGTCAASAPSACQASPPSACQAAPPETEEK